MLQLLIRLFGKDFLNKIIGTRTNVVKPIKLDRASPYKIYSDSAFNDPKLRQQIEDKLQEYAPLVLSNKNASEVANYEMNARRLLEAKNKEFGVTEGLSIRSDLMKMTDDDLNALAKEGEALQAKRVLTGEERKRLDYIGNLLEDAQKLPNTGKGLREDIRAAGGKPEADILDIKTGKKAEGIESLKEDLGLPPEVTPKSRMGGNLQELKRLTKEADLARKDIDETMDKGLEDIFKKFMKSPGKDTVMEGKRRAVIRKILLKDNRINLPKDVRTSLENYDDLRGGGTKEMDPLTIFDTYYKRDIDKLETLDSIIDTAENEVKAADEFRFLEDGFDLKKPEKDLGDKLKDLPDDIDPDAMAEGGRPGKGLDYLMGV